jgi:hypothetical protein
MIGGLPSDQPGCAMSIYGQRSLGKVLLRLEKSNNIVAIAYNEQQSELSWTLYKPLLNFLKWISRPKQLVNRWQVRVIPLENCNRFYIERLSDEHICQKLKNIH